MPGKGTVSKWVKKEHHNIAVLKKEGSNFEVGVDPDFALQLKKGEDVDMKDVLNAEQVFFDTRKGLLASEEKLKAVFGTEDVLEIAKKIIREGEIHLTAEYKNQLREDKRKQIISIISRNAIDPKTRLPHPPARIEAAIKEAKVGVDDLKSADEQVEEVVQKLKPIIPISFETKEVEVSIPSNHAASAYPLAKKFGKIKKQEWNSDGSWTGVIEVPAGILQDMIDKLNSMTHGGIDVKIIGE